MPYYSEGDYYQGDNYAAGGLLGTLGKIGKGIFGLATGGPSGLGIAARGLQTVIPGIKKAFVKQPKMPGSLDEAMLGGGFLGGRRRRINPLNIKALRRAMRRAKGFERQARRVGSFFSPGKTFRLKGRKRRAS